MAPRKSGRISNKKGKSAATKVHCLACNSLHTGPNNASCPRATAEQVDAFATLLATGNSADTQQQQLSAVLTELKQLKAATKSIAKKPVAPKRNVVVALLPWRISIQMGTIASCKWL